MHGMHPTAYFRATINAWCLATSLPAVLHSLEIKSPWEAAACQRYLRTGAASSCAHTREADGSCTRHMSPAQAGQGRAQHRGTSLLEIPAFPTKNTAPLFLCSICRARDGKEQSRSLLCPGFLRSSASSDGAEHLQHPLLLALIRQEERRIFSIASSLVWIQCSPWGSSWAPPRLPRFWSHHNAFTESTFPVWRRSRNEYGVPCKQRSGRARGSRCGNREDTKRKVQLQIVPDSETGFPHPLQLHKI